MAVMKMVTVFWLTIIVLVVAGVGSSFLIQQTPGKYDALAQCLKDKGVTFYGAFWCPHCQKQKRLFGRSADLLPYVECSTPDGKGQLQGCIDKGITNYPTWDFPDGSRVTGEVSLADLAQKSGCMLPE